MVIGDMKERTYLGQGSRPRGNDIRAESCDWVGSK